MRENFFLPGDKDHERRSEVGGKKKRESGRKTRKSFM